jgi:hypothetical protein
MSYEMTGQHTTYPYPPPANAVVAPKRSHFSKWWPLSFFITAIIFFIIGGGLLGGWSASAVDCVDDYYYSSSYKSYTSCYDTGNKGLFYGGVACVALGGICKLIFWILLIVWCVKRSSRVPISASYTYQPINNYAAPPPPAAPAAAAAAAPMYNAPPYQSSPSPAPYNKESTTRYCGQCGAASTTPFCPQCGIRM